MVSYRVLVVELIEACWSSFLRLYFSSLSMCCVFCFIFPINTKTQLNTYITASYICEVADFVKFDTRSKDGLPLYLLQATELFDPLGLSNSISGAP